MPDYRDLRILITRLSAIGDCVLTVPMLCALRDHLPNAHLAWAVSRGGASLLEGHAALDDLIVVPRGWLKSPVTSLRFCKQLRARRFDICIDPQSLTKSALIGRLSGSKQRIGLGGQHGRELSKWLNKVHVEAKTPHVVDRSLELLSPLDIHSPAVRFDLPGYDEDAASVAEFLDKSHVAGPFAMVNVGASWPSKLWPLDRFAAVANYLGRRHDLPSVIVWAGDEEHRAAKTVTAACPQYALLAPPTSLRELACLARRTQVFVSSDTGPLHLAAAVGTPCVGLYGPTRPEVCGPYGPQHEAVQAFYQDGSHRERRRAENTAMQAISVDDVCGACQKVLSRAADDQASAA